VQARTATLNREPPASKMLVAFFMLHREIKLQVPWFPASPPVTIGRLQSLNSPGTGTIGQG
jgi:hypothetical protein